MTPLPGDPELPPGVTNADIDDVRCEECGAPMPAGRPLCRRCQEDLDDDQDDQQKNDDEEA